MTSRARRLTSRGFRRFVTGQRSPEVRRWLRRTAAPSAVLVHASREAIASPTFPEVVEALTAGLETAALADGWNAFPRYGTASYWCRLCDSTGPGLLVDHFTTRHPDELPPPVDVRAALGVCDPIPPRYDFETI